MAMNSKGQWVPDWPRDERGEIHITFAEFDDPANHDRLFPPGHIERMRKVIGERLYRAQLARLTQEAQREQQAS